VIRRSVTFSLVPPLLLVVSLFAAGARGQQSLLTRDSKRECANCHLDWVDSFERPGAVLLIDRPVKPAAALEETCRGCHDGSVGDSRREVWLEHGHRVNEKPTDRIKVPDHMPLEDGRMVCRTCHTAHAVPTANDLSKVVFLRAAKEGGLCQQCHVDRAYAAEHTSHPLAKLPFPLPEELHDAHARTDIADRTKMACQTCHTTHGARQDHLLVMGTASGQLCVTCHEKLRPVEWKPDAPREHPQNPPLKTTAQKQAIADMGTRVGPGDTLTCFSCHKMHTAKTGKYMLADTLEQSRLCIRCHEDRKSVLASTHDLRQSKPLEKNRLDQTADQSGPCGACHSFHRYARDPKPSSGDPTGRCTTCHPAATANGANKGLPFAHPANVPASKIPAGAKLNLPTAASDPSTRTLTCNTCHDPHASGVARFARLPKDALCAACHTAPAASLAGAHDFGVRPDLKNGRDQSAAESGKCAFCHAVHTESPRAMWVATKDLPGSPNELCTACHRAGALALKTPGFAFNHPTGPTARPTSRPTATLPLFNDKASIDADGYVACASCHNPHADSNKDKAMLRTPSPVSNLCTQCHADNAAMAGGPHDARGKKDFPIDKHSEDLCTSCHRPHSDDAIRQRYTFLPAANLARPDGACVACHPKQTWSSDDAPVLGRSLHPATMPAQHASTSSGLPLLDAADRGKQIACKTCHNPHASPATPKLTHVNSGQPASALCDRCHTPAESLARSMHAPDALRAKDHPPGAATCGPCHATHAVEGSQKQLLWANKVLGWDLADPDQRCMSCHETNPPGRRILIQHPADPVRTFPWSTTRPATAPVAAAVGCAACHLTHGEPSARAESDLNARRAARPMIRPDVVRQCANCHGPAANQLFLYWHTPAKRAKAHLLPGN
jgi:predicted CXXCH cytochrome family protein